MSEKKCLGVLSILLFNVLKIDKKYCSNFFYILTKTCHIDLAYLVVTRGSMNITSEMRWIRGKTQSRTILLVEANCVTWFSSLATGVPSIQGAVRKGAPAAGLVNFFSTQRSSLFQRVKNGSFAGAGGALISILDTNYVFFFCSMCVCICSNFQEAKSISQHPGDSSLQKKYSVVIIVVPPTFTIRNHNHHIDSWSYFLKTLFNQQEWC